MIPRSELILDAKLIMRDGFLDINPAAQLDEAGYTERWEQNLLAQIDPRGVEADLADKGGIELDKKLRAAHSSAALAVNSFASFRDRGHPVPVLGWSDLKVEGFERGFPTGLRGKSPHLDLTLRNDHLLIAVESKCLEYFTSKPATFTKAYFDKILDDRRSGPWFAEMLRLRERPLHYEFLDAAQLVKHAFGLAWTQKQIPTVLLYLFWEPDDAENHAIFKEHRQELVTFAKSVDGGQPAFAFMSYQELWAAWATSGSALIRNHANLLQLRYCGRLGSYEGFTRVNGRKTDSGFWDDLDLD